MKWIPYILSIAGAVVLYSALMAHSDSISSEYWPSTEGEIVSTYIKKEVTPAEHASITYTAVINYEYTVNTKKYSNNRYSFGTTSYSRKNPQKTS